jgi:hypothetical protein
MSRLTDEHNIVLAALKVKKPKKSEQLSRLNFESAPTRWLRRVVQGYFNYHAVPGNVYRLGTFRKEVARAWLHVLRQRGVISVPTATIEPNCQVPAGYKRAS